jgi:regulatory protein
MRMGQSRPRSRSNADTGDRPGDDDPDASPESVARRIALTALTTAPRTRSELATLLAKREVPGEVAEAVLDRFGEVGLVDDAAFASAWVDSRHAGRSLGRRALGDELRRKGVDNEVTSVALEQVTDADELLAARGLVRRRLAGVRDLEPAKRDRRLLGMLARRGYPAGTAWAAIKAELQDASEPPVDFDD